MGLKINRQFQSPNFDDRASPWCDRGADSLILHGTWMTSSQAALSRLCDPNAKVSCHYLLNEMGEIYALVNEDKRAWHAGLSYWQGVKDMNSASIGIELHNDGNSPYPEAQITSLIALIKDIFLRHDIAPARVLAHSDIAPDRKDDPGHHFPWQALASQQIGIYPNIAQDEGNPKLTNSFKLQELQLRSLLATIGYDPEAKNSIEAFALHYYSDYQFEQKGELDFSKLIKSAESLISQIG